MAAAATRATTPTAILAYTAEGYRWLRQELTCELAAAYYKDLGLTRRPLEAESYWHSISFLKTRWAARQPIAENRYARKSAGAGSVATEFAAA